MGSEAKKTRNLKMSNLSFKSAEEKLQKLGQTHVLEGWKNLDSFQQQNLLSQIESLDLSHLELCRNQIFQSFVPPASFEPLENVAYSGSEEDRHLGFELMKQGKCACLVVAGGQGSRLGFHGPKGCFPISPLKKKTFFQILGERVKAASEQVEFPLEIAIMTSPLNHNETKQFFIEHQFFGLKPSQVHFFEQSLWPLFDFSGNLFLEKPGQIAFGPNGNGGALRLLSKSDIYEKWKRKGVEMVNFVLIDNLLAFPFDVELFGFHHRNQNAVSIKASRRLSPEEKVGVLVQKRHSVAVIEYSEFPVEEKGGSVSGEFKYPFANLSLFCFDMSFIESLKAHLLPMHKMRKAVPKMDVEGICETPRQPNAWKFEEFIFDVLELTTRVKTLVYPREEVFAPLKNREGADSIKTVHETLLHYDLKVLKQLTGVSPKGQGPLELSQNFYYPNSELLKKLKGRSLEAKGEITA